jgi:hypothetical protein
LPKHTPGGKPRTPPSHRCCGGEDDQGADGIAQAMAGRGANGRPNAAPQGERSRARAVRETAVQALGISQRPWPAKTLILLLRRDFSGEREIAEVPGMSNPVGATKLFLLMFEGLVLVRIF